MTKIIIATPAYTGTVHSQYAVSLAETKALLKERDIESEILINKSSSLITVERNSLVYCFMQTDATHMLCIDADLGWPPQSVIDLIDYDEEFVGGVYPSRTETSLKYLARPLLYDSNTVYRSSKNLIAIEYMPAGFMLLKRSVIEKMIDKFSDLFYYSNQLKVYCLFDQELSNGIYWGEDFIFCRRAREAGIKIWADPVIEFDHAGNKGMYMEELLKFKVGYKDI